MSKHTPGPWVIRFNDIWINKGPTVGGAADYFERVDLKSESNMFLVSAAPELLEALCLAASILGMVVDHSGEDKLPLEVQQDLSKIHKAIRKAKGVL